jgi:hypothetical protein
MEKWVVMFAHSRGGLRVSLRRLRQLATGALSAAAVTLSLALTGAAAQAATTGPHTLATGWTTLALKNGWSGAPFSTHSPAVRTISGIVHFRGAMSTSGSNPVAFVLPKAFRPTTFVYVPVDLCNATNGRLIIAPTGTVRVEAETSFSNAQCFTSLDGASYGLGSGFTTLGLINGWTGAPFSTGNPAVRTVSGVVHFRGAMATSGSNSEPFVLPTAFRPAKTVFVKVDMCDATNGRLEIDPNGVVFAEAESDFTNAQCFTSLDGASFALPGSGFTTLGLINGWSGGPFGTASPAVRTISGIIHLRGAMATSGSNSEAFVLPKAFRPTKTVFVPVDLCDATNGRLNISPSGVVDVEAETSFSNAQCFTSLDGVSFAP